MASTLLHYLLWRLGIASPETQTSPAERAALAHHARGRRTCVEIGVWHGVNTRRIRQVMAPDGTLTGVDPFPPGRLGFSFPRAIALREIARCPCGSATLLRLTSADAAKDWSVPIDFLFVDGDHSYEALRTDWESWSPHIAPGGIVCLHDSHPTTSRPIESAGSVRFTSEVILRDRRFALVEVVDTLTVLVRRAT